MSSGAPKIHTSGLSSHRLRSPSNLDWQKSFPLEIRMIFCVLPPNFPGDIEYNNTVEFKDSGTVNSPFVIHPFYVAKVVMIKSHT